jgi:hypothetical protein
VLALGAGAALRYARGKAAVPPNHSIAVLPLENFSGDPSQDYFVDGMTDELITDLAKVGALRVTSRTSVMRYKGAKKSLQDSSRTAGGWNCRGVGNAFRATHADYGAIAAWAERQASVGGYVRAGCWRCAEVAGGSWRRRSRSKSGRDSLQRSRPRFAGPTGWIR